MNFNPCRTACDTSCLIPSSLHVKPVPPSEVLHTNGEPQRFVVPRVGLRLKPRNLNGNNHNTIPRSILSTACKPSGGPLRSPEQILGHVNQTWMGHVGAPSSSNDHQETFKSTLIDGKCVISSATPFLSMPECSTKQEALSSNLCDTSFLSGIENRTPTCCSSELRELKLRLSAIRLCGRENAHVDARGTDILDLTAPFKSARSPSVSVKGRACGKGSTFIELKLDHCPPRTFQTDYTRPRVTLRPPSSTTRKQARYELTSSSFGQKSEVRATVPSSFNTHTFFWSGSEGKESFLKPSLQDRGIKGKGYPNHNCMLSRRKNSASGDRNGAALRDTGASPSPALPSSLSSFVVELRNKLRTCRDSLAKHTQRLCINQETKQGLSPQASIDALHPPVNSKSKMSEIGDRMNQTESPEVSDSPTMAVDIKCSAGDRIVRPSSSSSPFSNSKSSRNSSHSPALDYLLSTYYNDGMRFLMPSEGQPPKLRRAIVAFSTALELQPNHILCRLQRAAAYTVVGEYEAAVADYYGLIFPTFPELQTEELDSRRVDTLSPRNVGSGWYNLLRREILGHLARVAILRGELAVARNYLTDAAETHTEHVNLSCTSDQTTLPEQVDVQGTVCAQEGCENDAHHRRLHPVWSEIRAMHQAHTASLQSAIEFNESHCQEIVCDLEECHAAMKRGTLEQASTYIEGVCHTFWFDRDVFKDLPLPLALCYPNFLMKNMTLSGGTPLIPPHLELLLLECSVHRNPGESLKVLSARAGHRIHEDLACDSCSNLTNQETNAPQTDEAQEFCNDYNLASLWYLIALANFLLGLQRVPCCTKCYPALTPMHSFSVLFCTMPLPSRHGSESSDSATISSLHSTDAPTEGGSFMQDHIVTASRWIHQALNLRKEFAACRSLQQTLQYVREQLDETYRCWRLGREKRAVECLNLIVAAAASTSPPNKSLRVYAVRLRAAIHAYAANYDAAERDGHMLLMWAEEDPTQTVDHIIDVLLHLARVKVEQGQPQLAMTRYLDRAVELSSKATNNLSVALQHRLAVQKKITSQHVNQLTHSAMEDLYEFFWNHQNQCSYYDYFGLTMDCDEVTLRKRYRELILVCHPDKCISHDLNERSRREHYFLSIQEMFHTLNDKERRKSYDTSLS